MTIESRLQGMWTAYLADERSPNILGFMEQLFSLAAESGTVVCDYHGEGVLRFSIGHKGMPGGTANPSACFLNHQAAKSIVRMLCARLGAICQQQTGKPISFYGDSADIDYDVSGHRRWTISFINTPEQQKFAIASL
jgi:hypothetical protein